MPATTPGDKEHSTVKKFKVMVYQTVVERSYIIIEAESKLAAEDEIERILEDADEGGKTPDVCGEWKFCYVEKGLTAGAVTPVEPESVPE